jgi:hypothetical protein
LKDGVKISVKCVVEKAMSITISIHSEMEQIKIELVICMGYFWDYQVCNWTGTVTIQIVVLSVTFSTVSVVYPTIFLQIIVLWGLDAIWVVVIIFFTCMMQSNHIRGQHH